MLTKEDFIKNIGHFCTMDDGSKGFICKTEMDNPRVLHNLPEKYWGWPYSLSISNDNAPKSLKKKFSYAWNICNDGDAKCSGVKRILKKCIDLDSKKTTESPKTILDMTVKELLEKLDEIIKCQFRCKDCKG